MSKNKKIVRLTVTAMFMALVLVMTFVPYFGYINYGLVLEFTTIHIVVIFGAAILGPKSGAVLGGFWGVTCLLRALTNTALYGLFLNPLISIVPRIFVGLLAGLIFKALKGTKLKPILSLGITAAAGTLTNTVLVLGSIFLFGEMLNPFADLYALVSGIFSTIIGVNGVIELVGAIILVPSLYLATNRFFEKKL